jgi:hypothetical protein
MNLFCTDHVTKRKVSKNDYSKISPARATGVIGPIQQRRAKHCNWLKPELWKQIDAAARACHFHTQEMVKMLRLQLGGEATFCNLTAGMASLHFFRHSGMSYFVNEFLGRFRRFWMLCDIGSPCNKPSHFVT